MSTRLLMILLIVALSSLIPKKVQALDMQQFKQICHSGKVECSEHPLINAYVGGALDLIAMLDQETKYLNKFYCKKSQALFDVKAIIQFMVKHQEAYAKRNAMLLVIRYLEEKGSC